MQISFADLIGTTTASHIHCCTATPGAGAAGVATQTPTFANFPLGVHAGAYDQTFDLTDAASWNVAFINAHGGTPAGTEGALAAGLAAGEAYLNIHTSEFPGGEIRGFLAVPEPSTASLVALGIAIYAIALISRSARSFAAS